MSDAARRAKARRARNTQDNVTKKMRTGKKLHNPSAGSSVSNRRAIEIRTKFTEDGKKQKNDVICTKK
jgi:hypothetical protein|tara:strand:- start:39 stop:242 length:204 start_codon:yes stop_codon:yes gene_type:complete